MIVVINSDSYAYVTRLVMRLSQLFISFLGCSSLMTAKSIHRRLYVSSLKRNSCS